MNRFQLKPFISICLAASLACSGGWTSLFAAGVQVILDSSNGSTSFEVKDNANVSVGRVDSFVLEDHDLVVPDPAPAERRELRHHGWRSTSRSRA